MSNRNDYSDVGDAPAFPAPPSEHAGMELRDWFAGQAIVGMAGSLGEHWLDVDMQQSAALSAYGIADAMVDIRELERAERVAWRKECDTPPSQRTATS